MLISAIVAVSKNHVIGRDGHLPWHLSADLKRFRRITTGHHIILGRKNYEDIGRPLPGRVNLVLSRNPEFRAPGCIVCPSLEAAVETARAAGESECFLIGGAKIYNMGLPLCKKLYITRVLHDIEGDVYLNLLETDWRCILKKRFPADEKNDYPTEFQILVR